MDNNAALRRTEQAIVRLGHEGLDSHTLRVEVLRRLRTVVPVDAAFCATVDPATLLFTGSMVEEIPEHATPAFLANEFLQVDVNKFVALARAAQPVQSLYAATRGEPEGSQRYREILVPIGFGDELRAADSPLPRRRFWRALRRSLPWACGRRCSSMRRPPTAVRTRRGSSSWPMICRSPR
jgi:hypothetical protein